MNGWAQQTLCASAPPPPSWVLETVVHAQGCRFELIIPPPPLLRTNRDNVWNVVVSFCLFERRGLNKHHERQGGVLIRVRFVFKVLKDMDFWSHSSVRQRTVQAFRSIAPRCMLYYIESRCSSKKHCYLKVFNWRLHFKTASPAAGFILIAGSNALNEASCEECG